MAEHRIHLGKCVHLAQHRLALGEKVEAQAEFSGGPLLVGAAWEAWMTHD